MPKTTAAPAREQIEQEVAEAEQRAAMLRDQLWREDEAKRQRREDAQREWDEQFVACFSRAQVFADTEQAREDLIAALAENPLIAAFADYFAALRRRSWAIAKHNEALNRLGQTPPPVTTLQTELSAVEILDLLQRAAERIATDRVGAELAEQAASREAAADSAEREG
jgi:uncharacterized small protein (DUF1192 family)